MAIIDSLQDIYKNLGGDVKNVSASNIEDWCDAISKVATPGGSGGGSKPVHVALTEFEVEDAQHLRADKTTKEILDAYDSGGVIFDFSMGPGIETHLKLEVCQKQEAQGLTVYAFELRIGGSSATYLYSLSLDDYPSTVSPDD